MNIAIVDDDPTLRISLKHFLHKWFGEQNLPLTMFEFDGGDEFLDGMKETEFDIVFMDIFMDKKNGIDTAEEMRRTNKNIVLVFLTSSADYMPDAFSVHAFGYLLKPLLPEKLYKVMSDIKSVSVAESEPKFEVSVGKNTLTLNYSEIIYINSDSNYCLIHCPDPVKCRGPFTALCKPLEDSDDFLYINRGIMVNMRHVTQTTATICTMDNGDLLPLNTKKAAAIKQRITAYKFNHRS